MLLRFGRVFGAALLLFFSIEAVWADSKNLAPGFSELKKGAVVALMQPDVELFSISAGGVPEPKADWTGSALKHVQDALSQKTVQLGLNVRELSDNEADELAEINTLHAAVANSIALHHMTVSTLALPTKDGKLDWSLGEAVQPLREKTGADYALFVWMRDSYASTERKVAMVAFALLGVGIGGGVQTGYASLVDLHTGQVLWFNKLLRGTGDLREAGPAQETVMALLKQFPEAR